jgi:hypothetical protein
MTSDGWKELILQAAYEAEVGDYEKVDLLAKLLEEMDGAKQLLRDKGYGVTGVGIFETVKEVPAAVRAGQ